MTQPQINSWQAIQNEVLRRIHAREWKPGQVIPNEVDLAAEFGCARATMNRALRALADAGMLERRRKAGTRVALHPVSRATVDIPFIRQEIEARGQTYSYKLITRATAKPPAILGSRKNALHVTALHFADAAPYAFEDRWINLETLPDANAQPFTKLNANEWLLMHAPFTHGDIRFSALAATAPQAKRLGADPGAPVFVIDRTTWDHHKTITSVRLIFAPGYSIHTTIGSGPLAE
jgi:GntR family histidine utilization transcriptional repressor